MNVLNVHSVACCPPHHALFRQPIRAELIIISLFTVPVENHYIPPLYSRFTFTLHFTLIPQGGNIFPSLHLSTAWMCATRHVEQGEDQLP